MWAVIAMLAPVRILSPGSSSPASLASPVEIKGEGRVEKIVIGRNELVEEGGTLRARDSGEREELECGLVLRSVGYTGVPIEGVPFDEKRGLILNEGGRVLETLGERVSG